MRIDEIRTLAGPNICSHRPALVMKLFLDELTGRESREFSDFNERLLDLLPGLREHHCAQERPGGFFERLESGTYFGHIIEHIALELTCLADIPVFHGKTRRLDESGCYNIYVEYKAEQGTKFLLCKAVDVVEALLRGEAFPLEETIIEAKKLVNRTELGPSTKSIVDAAIRRNIPWRRIGQGSLVQLGYGKYRKLIQASVTSQTSAVGVDISCDKALTKTLFHEASIPVPEGVVVESEGDAVIALMEIDKPVAVKPLNGSQGKGISLNLTTAAQVEHAFRLARQYSSNVIIEEMLTGHDYRVLVVNGRMVAASERIPAHIIGDGRHKIIQLIEIVNQDPERGDGHDKSLTRLTLDPLMMEFLREQDLTINSVPREGEVVYLRQCANLSTGGTARDVTEIVHPHVREICERAARTIGLDVCGIDLISHDIAEPLREGDAIVEINASPGLRMHCSPSEGSSRDVGEAIVETLFPLGFDGRIPIVSITGTNGKTTITRMIGKTLELDGKVVGVTTTDGIFINGKSIVHGDTTGPRSARTVLADPEVEVAVLETARGGIVRSGLGYDWSDVAIISNIRSDHLGQDGIESLDDLVYIKSLVAERVREGGTLVLNADDRLLAQLIDEPRVNRVPKQVVWYSLHPYNTLIHRHLAAGGTAYLYKHGWITEATGNSQQLIIRAEEIPITFDGAADFQIANVLAVTAACRAMGLSHERIAQALREFCADIHNTGRANLYQVQDGYVMIDYGHNPDAFAAMCNLAARWEDRSVTGIVGVPGDRNNQVIEESAQAAARGFEKIIVREDKDLRGRLSNEVVELLHRAILAENPECDCRLILDEIEAVETALQEMKPGEVVVIFYEKLDPILAVLDKFGAKPVDHIAEPSFDVVKTLKFRVIRNTPGQYARQA